MIEWATWQAPANIVAGVTLRQGGHSLGAYASNNLATHVGDDPQTVEENRLQLHAMLPGIKHWQWLDQVHGTSVSLAPAGKTVAADAAYTRENGVVCAVLTADCLPVLLADKYGREVAAIHAGWRGLCAGIIENTLASFSANPQDIVAWLGPAIGVDSFEVGEDVRLAFAGGLCGQVSLACFAPGPTTGKYWADIYGLAKVRLEHAGLKAIAGGENCTYRQPEKWYSYRRDGVTGRMASFIYIR